MGYSRDSFYRFKELYDKDDELVLQEISRRKPVLKNRTAPEIEAAVVEFAIRAAGQRRKCGWPMRRPERGLSISQAGVRCGVAAPRLGDDEQALEGLRGQGRAGRSGSD